MCLYTVTGWGVMSCVCSMTFLCGSTLVKGFPDKIAQGENQWIVQRQVGPVSVYCEGVGCHVLCLQHDIPVWQHIGQSTTATSRHRRDMTSDGGIIWALHVHFYESTLKSKCYASLYMYICMEYVC